MPKAIRKPVRRKPAARRAAKRPTGPTAAQKEAFRKAEDVRVARTSPPTPRKAAAPRKAARARRNPLDRIREAMKRAAAGQRKKK